MSRIFSGIQPSGELHIGNWLGAVQNWVHLQQSYQRSFLVGDLPSITGKYDAASLASRTHDMTVGLLAAGVDPEKATLFVQSQVPEHAQLQWLLNTVTPLGELERMTQFKDKSQRFESIPAGVLNYPILMAADILLYKADLVPVGEDQVQHLELTPAIARGGLPAGGTRNSVTDRTFCRSRSRCSPRRSGSWGSTARPRCRRAWGIRSGSWSRLKRCGQS